MHFLRAVALTTVIITDSNYQSGCLSAASAGRMLAGLNARVVSWQHCGQPRDLITLHSADNSSIATGPWGNRWKAHSPLLSFRARLAGNGRSGSAAEPLRTDETDHRIQQTPELHRLLATDRSQFGGEFQSLLMDSHGSASRKARPWGFA